jgi:nitrogen fixation/metabolism regulation signal transduction histidine kinase
MFRACDEIVVGVCSGISAEDQAKLFEPYSFVTSGWVEKSGVSGLGLSMAKRYVEKVGGNIGVKSSLGKGSTLLFHAMTTINLRFRNQTLGHSHNMLLKLLEFTTFLSLKSLFQDDRRVWNYN